MKKKLIAGNWKLNPSSLKKAKQLVAKIDRNPFHETVICPPPAWLASLDYPRLGSQDCFWQEQGPYTGQISPLHLKDLGVKYCLVGHSEKRATGESELMVREKLAALASVKITPILCVGYGTKVDQDDMEVIEVLKSQLDSAFKQVLAKNVVVAYEPVWAISAGNPYRTNKIATPEHAEKIALYIRAKYAPKKVIYGGSVNAVNAMGFLKEPHLDGLLVGGASLLPGDFNTIINLQ